MDSRFALGPQEALWFFKLSLNILGIIWKAVGEYLSNIIIKNDEKIHKMDQDHAGWVKMGQDTARLIINP